MAKQKKDYTLIIEDEKLSDLIQLSEEPDLSKTIIRALTLYYHTLKLQTEGYKLAMVPTTEDGELSFARKIVFIDIDHI